jgi:ceramide glucosyltransferase
VIHHPAFWVLAIISAAAAAYQAIALVATIRHFRGRANVRPEFAPPISILKPMYGSSPGLYAALRSHAVQDYPEFEIVFGVRSLDDPCIADIERLRCEFPNLRVRLVQCRRKTPNGKVGVLADMVREARYALLLVNDDDITVPAGYLRDVVAPMAEPVTGIVTCLYRATADHLPGRWEGLGIVTDFAPSTLVAPFVGISEFGLGSTIVFRREDLNAIGGFEAIADYIADDYQLGARIHRLGRRNVISRVVVETHLDAVSWGDVWQHQVRWARTIRLSRGAYAGLFITYATFWALVDAAFGFWWLAVPLLVLRMIMATAAGWWGMRSRDVLRLWPLIPLRDLWAAGVWLTGLFGNSVRWRDRELTLDREGRIIRSGPIENGPPDATLPHS